MNRTILTISAALIATGAIGCGNKSSSSIPTSDTVADISPATAAPAHQAAPQPVVYDMSASSNSAPMTSMASGTGNYTVKRGDTLYGIARQRYGDGKQWQKIAQANPGLRPESLKVGQSIVIP